MSFSYDLSTDIGKIRLNIGDTSNSPTSAIFTNEEIQSILDQYGDINTSTGVLLLIIANSKARLAKYKSAGKYSEDTRSIAKELRDQANAWFDMAKIPYDEVVEQTFGDPSSPWFGSQEREWTDRENLRNN